MILHWRDLTDQQFNQLLWSIRLKESTDKDAIGDLGGAFVRLGMRGEDMFFRLGNELCDVYDGEDLAEVSARLKLKPGRVN